jgi:hypothetical protein
MSELGIICEEEPDECELCGKFEETRPYGPNGERVCFECGMKNEDAARKAFSKLVLGKDHIH